MNFEETVAAIPQIGLDWHRERILENSRRNAPFISKTVRDIQPKGGRALVIAAGPSLYRERLIERIAASGELPCTTIATDGAYIRCLKHGILPDYVITLDPHPTRIIRWFGDPDYSGDTDDDYFKRQDLDVAFRTDAARLNAENIRTVDENKCPLVICTTAPENVVARTSGFDRYWFAPLVDHPAPGSLTREIVNATKAPALNTGGTVGTAAWCFAYSILKSADIAVVGMDFGYYEDLPLEQTQEWNMLKDGGNVEEMFPYRRSPWGRCRTSPTYTFYRNGLMDLLRANHAEITNCSEHGILFGPYVALSTVEQWLAS